MRQELSHVSKFESALIWRFANMCRRRRTNKWHTKKPNCFLHLHRSRLSEMNHEKRFVSLSSNESESSTSDRFPTSTTDGMLRGSSLQLHHTNALVAVHEHRLHRANFGFKNNRGQTSTSDHLHQC
mmetsp:Transcript_25539/g.64381  ORF Transcript_25539/g.64381 Transcript_25539/m.64381 type:complete len:126 (-) Transcript_25539:2257-2634(-)